MIVKVDTSNIDMSKAEHEFVRMVQGEIPYNPGYLSELVEYNEREFPNGLFIGMVATCGTCNTECYYVECPECLVLSDKDCDLCNGLNGWFECACFYEGV